MSRMEQDPAAAAGSPRRSRLSVAASRDQFENGHDPGTALSLIPRNAHSDLQPQLGSGGMIQTAVLERSLRPPQPPGLHSHIGNYSSSSSVEMIIRVPVDTVWAVITDWFSVLYGWPDDLIIQPLEGANACPGALRYSTDKGNPGAIWIVERLLSLAPDQNEMSYLVEESNIVGIRGHRGSCRLLREAIACVGSSRIVSADGSHAYGGSNYRDGVVRSGLGGFREATRVVWKFQLPLSAASSGVTEALVRESLVVYIKSIEDFCINHLS